MTGNILLFQVSFLNILFLHDILVDMHNFCVFTHLSCVSACIKLLAVYAALLPLCPSTHRLLSIDWTAQSYSTCFFVFSTSSCLKERHVLTSQALKQEGFLPSGVFERLLARGCIWSQKTTLEAMQQLEGMLFKNVAALPFGGQNIRLVIREDVNCIQMDVEGMNPLGAFHRVKDQIETIIKECMQSLRVFSALEIPISSGTLKGILEMNI